LHIFCISNPSIFPREHLEYLKSESECGSNRISDANFLIVFRSNYGSFLLSFCHAMLCVSVAYAIVWCLSITFVYCVETAKDVAIVATEYEL